MSESYIRVHFNDIKQYACAIENRLDDDGCTLRSMLEDNAHTMSFEKENDIDYILIDRAYKIDIDLS